MVELLERLNTAYMATLTILRSTIISLNDVLSRTAVRSALQCPKANGHFGA